MNDPDYKSERLITAERLLASLLVLLWVGLAGSMGGLALAVRAFLLFMVPLAMIWFPQLLARLALREDRWGPDFSPSPSAHAEGHRLAGDRRCARSVVLVRADREGMTGWHRWPANLLPRRGSAKFQHD